MTESEAINFFKDFIDTLKINGVEQVLKNDYCKSANIAIKALEKQIPKKVIKWADGTEHCPTCDCDNSCIGYGVCIDCGQKLDWSDTD